MPGLNFSFMVMGAEEISKKLSRDTVRIPLMEGLKKLGLLADSEVKKATVVDTGRLRSSMTTKSLGDSVSVGTNVNYATFVEYGTRRMEARHMEGARKVLGQGMFSYALVQLKDKAQQIMAQIGKAIEARFG